MPVLLHQTVDHAASRESARIAVSCLDDSLTYEELSRQTNALAHSLVDGGVKRGDRVGIYAGKGVLSAVAIHGIMKAGAAYVPLDPSAPTARTAQIIKSCAMRAIVSEESKRGALCELLHRVDSPELLVGVASGDDLPVRALPWDAVALAPDAAPPAIGTLSEDLAYVLFTSGSTGTPKGIMHTHRSGLAWAQQVVKTYGLTSDDRISNHAPLQFDLSTLDYFGASLAAATTVVIPEAHTRMPASLSALMEHEQLTVFYSVPFAWIQLLLHGAIDKRDLRSLRWVLFGGEPFPVKHLAELMRTLPHARFCNVYGPTEVNGCTHFPVPRTSTESEEPVPIGMPYENVEALVVDEDDEPVEPGMAGELLIDAPTMMRGYWDDEASTREATFLRPRADGGHDRFHRTGDIVARLPDGNLRFLGRRDRQVKVRGHRVELDEIEAALNSHGAVVETAVVAVAGADRTHHALHASVTLREGSAPTTAELRDHARRLIPAYAVPEWIEVLRAFPRTATGKIDRRRLAPGT